VRSAALLISVLCLAAACHDHGDHHHDGDQFICDGGEDTPTAGAAVSGDTLTVTIVDSSAAEHTTDRNTLRVSITDGAGAVTGAVFDEIRPFTAKHDHGTPVLAEWAEVGGGEYDITNINYVHRGPWELNLDITANGASDSVQFIFCIRDFGYEDGGAPDA
jgi:hypothetical protein